MQMPTRRDVLTTLAFAGAAAAGRQAVGTASAQTEAIGDSRMEQYDPANTGFAPNERGPRTDPLLLWRHDTGGPLRGSTAVVDGVAYTATEAGRLTALDAVDGTERWSVSLGEEIGTSPAVAGETVYVAAGESLYALSTADGTEQWVEPIGPDPSSPITAEGVVVVAGGNSVHVVTEDGESTSVSGLSGEVVSTPALAESVLYVATDAGAVYAFDVDRSDGTPVFAERWSTDTVIDRRPTVSATDGTVVVTGPSPGEPEQGRVYSLDAGSGEVDWEFTTTTWISSSPALDGNSVYVGCENGDLIALASDSGTERWRFNANSSWSVLYWGPGIIGNPIVADDTVYVASEDNSLYAVDAASGTPHWRAPTGDSIVSTPTVVDGVAFVGNTGGVLYAITSPETAPVPLDSAVGGLSVVTDFGGDGGEDRANDSAQWDDVMGVGTMTAAVAVVAVGVLYGVVRRGRNGERRDDPPSSERPDSDTDDADDQPETPSAIGDAATDGHPAGSDVVSSGEVGSNHTDEGSPRRELLAELRALDSTGVAIDRGALASADGYHPTEYEEAFGSIEAALEAAGLSSSDAHDEDRSAGGSGDGPVTGEWAGDDTRPDPTGKDEGDTTARTVAEKQTTTSEPTEMTAITPNELAELYAAFDRFQRVVAALASELDTDEPTPMDRWADAVADHWGAGGPDGAPNYGVQQRDRNEFSMRDYRKAYGDGDAVTEFRHVQFAPVDDRVRHLVGDAIDDWTHAVPVAPESETPLPVAITSARELDEALDLLGEFPAFPEADRPAPAVAESTERPLPEGRIESLTVTVLDHDRNPGPKRDGRLRVRLEDGSEMPFDVWTTHDLSLDWTVGDTYTIEEARHKSWETDTGTGHQLSSTSDLRVRPMGEASTGDASETPPSSPGNEPPTTTGETDSGSGGLPSRGALLDAIERTAETYDRPLKASDVSSVTRYSVNDVTRVFGSWQNGLAAAGIDNEARLLEDLRRVATELGHQPTTSEMNEHGQVSATTCANYFGSYTAATEAAFGESGAAQSPGDGDQASGTTTATADTPSDTTGGCTDDESGADETEGSDTTSEDDGILGDIMTDFEDMSGPDSE